MKITGGILRLLLCCNLIAWTSCAVAANLLQNADFQTHDQVLHVPPWQLFDSGNPQTVSAVIKESPAGDVVVMMNDVGTKVAPRTLLQQSIVLPESSPRLLLTVLIARDPTEPGPGQAPLRFLVEVNTPNGLATVPFELDTEVVPADGEFHQVVGRVPALPLDYSPGTTQFKVQKSGRGRYWIDGLVLEAEAPVFAIGPDEGPTSGGFVIIVLGGPVMLASSLHFGDAPASLVAANPGAAIAILPPGPSGAVDLNLILELESNGTHIQRPETLRSGFFYIEDLAIARFTPERVATSGGDILRFEGAGFLPPLQVLIDGIVSSIQPTLLSSREFLFSTPPLGSGIHSISVTNGHGQSITAAQQLFVGSTPQSTIFLYDSSAFRMFFPMQTVPELHFVVERSTNLRDWETEGVVITIRPDLGSGSNWSTHEASILHESGSSMFMRVRILP